MNSTRSYHLHLVSDATGETTHNIARACLVQFEGIEVIEHLWPMVRSKTQIEKVVAGIEASPGAVIFTLIDGLVRETLLRECAKQGIPCISVLDGVMHGLADYFGTKIRGQPGRQHLLDAEYFHRIEAMNFVMSHDDGQGMGDLGDAEIILVGVSRTSKTPTSIYLANHRGIRTANVPFVPGVPLPKELFEVDAPLIVGLTTAAERLIQIRENRILMLQQDERTAYVDPELVKRELIEARRLFTKMRWPVIDVTRRSIEETAAAILQHYTVFRETGEESDAVERS
ncbi:MAG: pyruvate, water dikinase regulatory protein [Acidiferrobacterales bacterium]